MTLKELLTLEEAEHCPGCPVCAPRLPRARSRFGTSREVMREPDGPSFAKIEDVAFPAGGQTRVVGRSS